MLFDGVCNLCNGVVRFIIARDPQARFRFAPLQAAEALDLSAVPLPVKGDPETIIYLRKGHVYQRSDAALLIAKDLGGIWSSLILFWPVPRILRDSVYRFIARRRYKIFGRKEQCMVPLPEWRQRFLN